MVRIVLRTRYAVFECSQGFQWSSLQSEDWVAGLAAAAVAARGTSAAERPPAAVLARKDPLPAADAALEKVLHL